MYSFCLTEADPYSTDCKEYEHYGDMDAWSLDEAASLLCDVQPGEFERCIAYKGSIGYIAAQGLSEKQEQNLIDRHQQYLKIRELLSLAKTVGKLKSVSTDKEHDYFEPDQVIEWAVEKVTIQVPEKLLTAVKVAKLPANPPLLHTEIAKGSQSDHPTPLLEYAHCAFEKFWLNAEKRPKGEVIIQWLVDEFHISRRAAESIDLLIRPPAYKHGGNIKLSSSILHPTKG